MTKAEKVAKAISDSLAAIKYGEDIPPSDAYPLGAVRVDGEIDLAALASAILVALGE